MPSTKPMGLETEAEDKVGVRGMAGMGREPHKNYISKASTKRGSWRRRRGPHCFLYLCVEHLIHASLTFPIIYMPIVAVGRFPRGSVISVFCL